MQLTKQVEPGSSTPRWRRQLRTLQDVSDRCDVLQKRTPDFYAKLRHRLQRLEQTRTRVAIAGAQGVGKSTLVAALLASRELPSPPIPVSEREETRVPIVCRWSSSAGYREVREGADHYRAGRLTLAQVRERASADSRVFDRLTSDYRSLLALELEDPGFALGPHADAVDLPGVSGNLAGVNEWARRFLLEDSTQALVFVVSSGQTIDCTEDEANLIRAYGPLMVRTVFVQNVWSGYDDDIEGTRAGNLEFLSEHIGEDAARHYLLLDCRDGLERARRGDREPLTEVARALEPLLDQDKDVLVREEAQRLASHLDQLYALVTADTFAAKGMLEEAGRVREKLEADRAALERVLVAVGQDVADERGALHEKLNAVAARALTTLRQDLASYIEGDRTLTRKLLEREVSRLLGRTSRAIIDGSSAAITEAADSLREAIRRRLDEELDVQTSPEVEFDLESFELPEIDLEALRKAVRLVTTVSSAVGAVVGTAIGSLFGPVGGVIGGILGGVVGWLGAKVGRSKIEAPIARKQRASILAAIEGPIAEARKETQSNLERAGDAQLDRLTKEIERIIAARTEALSSVHAPEEPARDLRTLNVDLSILREAQERLVPLLEDVP